MKTEIARADELGEDYRHRVAEVLVQGFAEDIAFFSKDAVATALMHRLLELPSDEFVLRDITDTNTPALGLYAKLGFTEPQRRHIKFAKRAGFSAYVSMGLSRATTEARALLVHRPDLDDTMRNSTWCVRHQADRMVEIVRFEDGESRDGKLGRHVCAILTATPHPLGVPNLNRRS